MWRQYRLLAAAALVAVLGAPLCFDGGAALERAIAGRLESLVSPTAAAAVIVPAEKKKTPPASPEQAEAARLLMGGTMLFGLAAVVRKSM